MKRAYYYPRPVPHERSYRRFDRIGCFRTNNIQEPRSIRVVTGGHLCPGYGLAIEVGDLDPRFAGGPAMSGKWCVQSWLQRELSARHSARWGRQAISTPLHLSAQFGPFGGRTSTVRGAARSRQASGQAEGLYRIARPAVRCGAWPRISRADDGVVAQANKGV